MAEVTKTFKPEKIEFADPKGYCFAVCSITLKTRGELAVLVQRLKYFANKHQTSFFLRSLPRIIRFGTFLLPFYGRNTSIY